MQLDTPLDQVFETGAHVRVLRALVGLPRGFAASTRDIARRAQVAHTTGARVLRGLTAQRIVHVTRVARADLYELNDEHVLVKEIRGLFASEGAFQTRLIDYLRAEIPRRVGRAEGAFLFGSASRGATRPDSDVDVAIMGHQRSADDLEPVVAAIEKVARDRFGVELNVILGPSRRRRDRAELWRRIERDGLPLVSRKAGRG